MQQVMEDSEESSAEIFLLEQKQKNPLTTMFLSE